MFKNSISKTPNGRLLKASPLFSRKYYQEKANLWFFQKPISHFLRNGHENGVSPSPHFDLKYYVAQYPDVRESRVNPLLHYLKTGWKEQRAPNPFFDSRSYCSAHPGVDFSTRLPVEHCLEIYGDSEWPLNTRYLLGFDQSLLSTKEKRTLKSFFDKKYYQTQYLDVDLSEADTFRHFEIVGWDQNRNPRAGFDTAFFRKSSTRNFRNRHVNSLAVLAQSIERNENIQTDESLIVFEAPKLANQAVSVKLTHAIHVHLYYPEIISEILNRLIYFKIPLNLVITTCSNANQVYIRQMVRTACKKYDLKIEFIVLVVPNRGRDIAPFLLAFRGYWKKFDVILHLHSKRSTHVHWGDDWRLYLFDNLIGSEAVFTTALDLFDADAKLGFLYPENFYRVKEFAEQDSNGQLLNAFMQRFGWPTQKFRNEQFSAGSMGWFRTATFAALLEKIDDIELFGQEEGQLDHTLAHVLERAFPRIAVLAGYEFKAFATAVRPKPESVFQNPGRDGDKDNYGVRWQRDTVAIAKSQPVPLAPLVSRFNPGRLNINWIIPDFGRGAGGHMTIFRMVAFFEKFGHRQTVWVQNPGIHTGPLQAKRAICDWYQVVGDDVQVRFLPDDVREISGDAIIATDCWTAYPATGVANVKERFYFIQDDETEFHPAGELRLAAEQTYHMGFAALCAGPWLLQRAIQRGMWARPWSLCSDPKYYFRANQHATGGPLKIAFYARRYTPRRAVNLGFAGLELLAKRKSDIEVHLFGEDGLEKSSEFACVVHGILSPAKLGELYRSCDIGVVFSATNYSLIPLEMMACGLPVVELDSQSTRCVFTDGEVAFAPPTPGGVADTIARLADNPQARAHQRAQSEKFLQGLNWESSARAVEAAILERLREKSYTPIDPVQVAAPAVHHPVTASVIIPTLNAGPAFQKVLERVASQNCPFPYDVLVIDSGSTDGTAEAVSAIGRSDVRLHQIQKSEFQHGRTRNLGIEMTGGAYVAVLTQDALPCDNHWLSSLIHGFSRSDRVAGVIGRHLAYPQHGAFAKRDLDRMFDRLNEFGDCFSLKQGLPSFIRPGSVEWRMLLQFYSDNNSAMSRQVWRECPYPEIAWGEDQVWGWEALKLGFDKVYVDEARVYHSHSFSARQQYDVSATEGDFWGRFFGLQLVTDVDAATHAANNQDVQFAIESGVSAALLKEQKILNRAMAEGRFAGYKASFNL